MLICGCRLEAKLLVTFELLLKIHLLLLLLLLLLLPMHRHHHGA